MGRFLSKNKFEELFKEAFSFKQPKEIYLNSWHCCYTCGCEKFGGLPKEDMDGITVMNGTCPICKKKNQTLIPYTDFIGYGD